MKPVDMFIFALTTLFIGLKLTHVIAWSWIWVLAPLWISVGIASLVTLGSLAVMIMSIKKINGR